MKLKLSDAATIRALIDRLNESGPTPALIDRIACWAMALNRNRRKPWASLRAELVAALWQRAKPLSVMAERSATLRGNVYILSFVRVRNVWKLEVW